MNKDEFFESIKAKININREEFNKLFDEQIVELKERGVPEAEHEKFALIMVKTRLKKQLMSPSKKFRGYLIGINPNAALNRNVDKVKEDGILQYRKDEQQAIEHKFVDMSGNPLWHIMEGINVAEWKLGNLITDEDYTCVALLLAKQEEEADYKLTQLTLRGKKIDIYSIPRFVELEFMANVKQTDSNIYVLNQSITTELKAITTEEINFPELARKYLKQNCIDFSSIEAWHDKNADDYNRLMVTKASCVSIIPSFDESKSHILNIDSGDIESTGKPLTCWVSPKEHLNFTEKTPEVFIIGSTNSKVIDDTQEVRYSINTYGIFVPKIWRVDKPKEIKLDEKKEEAKTEEW